jgi:hypothetical protein
MNRIRNELRVALSGDPVEQKEREEVKESHYQLSANDLGNVTKQYHLDLN